ncbi:MAG: MoaD/ThiS family protein [Chloroflexi bacterium]|nr:MoaD/ThiS family protein [Chloroflexota bacterium]
MPDTIKIKLLATLRELAGGHKELDLACPPDSTVNDLIATIQQASPPLHGKMIGADGELTGMVHIFVNGRNIDWLDGRETVITPKDVITLIPPVAGG